MTQRSRNLRTRYRKRFYYGESGEVFCNASGETALGLANIYGPSTEAVRSMLLSIRRRQKWSQAGLAAVLGVPKHTLRRWEDGSRQPCGSARKLIWFVHTLVFAPGKLLRDLDNFVTWGKAGRQERLYVDYGNTKSPIEGNAEQGERNYIIGHSQVLLSGAYAERAIRTLSKAVDRLDESCDHKSFIRLLGLQKCFTYELIECGKAHLRWSAKPTSSHDAVPPM